MSGSRTHPEEVRCCRNCGSPLPADSPGSACWECMKRMALGTASNPAQATEGTEGTYALSGETEQDCHASEQVSKEPVLLGDYLLEEQIAHGGMGVIYRARQRRLERVVALKLLLLGRYSSSESIRRFYREAQSAAALRHPNIVPVYEVGEANGQPFLAMEYVDGRSLAEVLRQGPLSPIRAAEYARSVADAVHYAHRRGVLHRDIKPSNVLLDAFDQVRLTDFGLAKKLDGSSDMTMTGEMMGSPNYLSPEQASARHEEVGPWSDVYGVGALLYELLTGRPPFMAQSIQDTLLHIRDNDPVPPARLNPAVPVDLDTITLKCLEKESDRRYRTAQEMAEDLGRFLRQEPIMARSASPFERTVKWVRRHRTRAALIATVALSLVAMTVGSLWFSFRVERARSETKAANLRLQRNLFVREWNDAEKLFDEGKPIPALTWFAQVTRRDPADHVAATRLLSLLNAMTFSIPAAPPLMHTGAVLSASFSSDGNQLLTGCTDGGVRMWSWREATPPRILSRKFLSPAATFIPGSHDDVVVADHAGVSLWSSGGIFQRGFEVSQKGHLRWGLTLDGRMAVVISDDAAPQLWDLREGRPRASSALSERRTRGMALTADGRFVVRPEPRPIAERSHVSLYDVETGQVKWRARLPIVKGPSEMHSVAISDDTTHVAIGRWNGTVLVWQVQFDGRESSEPPVDESPIFQYDLGAVVRAECFRFLDHNRRLLIGTTDGMVHLCDLTTGQVLPDHIQHSGQINAVVLSPRGDTLATASVDGSVRFWDLRAAVPKAVTVQQSNVVWDVAFAPDSAWFVNSGDPAAEIREVRTGALRHVLPMGGLVSRVAVSPDGRRVVTCTERGVLRIWDPKTGQSLTPPIQITERLHDLSFSADGRWICVGAPADRVWLLDATTGRPVMDSVLASARVVEAILTPDRTRLVAGTVRGEVIFWSLPDLKPISTTGVWFGRLG